MRILLAALSVLTVFSAHALRAQQEELVSYQVDTAPPLNDDDDEGHWVDPATLTTTIQLEKLRIRAHGYEGSWVRPVLDFASVPDFQSVFDAWTWTPPGGSDIHWLDNGATINVEDLIRPNTPAGQRVGVAVDSVGTEIPNPQSFQRWLTYALQNGTAGYSTNGVHSWSQPLLRSAPATGLQPTTHIWTANPALWTSGTYGNQSWTASAGARGHKAIWEVIRWDEDSDRALDAYNALRWAIVEQSIYRTGSVVAAAEFFNSTLWKNAIEGGWLELALQMLGIRPAHTVSEFEGVSWPHDISVPDLSNFTPPPTVAASESDRYTVQTPSERMKPSSDIIDADFIPGMPFYFGLSQGRTPVQVRFRTVTGRYAVVDAVADPTLFAPHRYRATAPPGIVPTAPIGLKAGSMPEFQEYGAVILPN